MKSSSSSQADAVSAEAAGAAGSVCCTHTAVVDTCGQVMSAEARRSAATAAASGSVVGPVLSAVPAKKGLDGSAAGCSAAGQSAHAALDAPAAKGWAARLCCCSWCTALRSANAGFDALAGCGAGPDAALKSAKPVPAPNRASAAGIVAEPKSAKSPSPPHKISSHAAEELGTLGCEPTSMLLLCKPSSILDCFGCAAAYAVAACSSWGRSGRGTRGAGTLICNQSHSHRNISSIRHSCKHERDHQACAWHYLDGCAICWEVIQQRLGRLHTLQPNNIRKTSKPVCTLTAWPADNIPCAGAGASWQAQNAS